MMSENTTKREAVFGALREILLRRGILEPNHRKKCVWGSGLELRPTQEYKMRWQGEERGSHWHLIVDNGGADHETRLRISYKREGTYKDSSRDILRAGYVFSLLSQQTDLTGITSRTYFNPSKGGANVTLHLFLCLHEQEWNLFDTEIDLEAVADWVIQKLNFFRTHCDERFTDTLNKVAEINTLDDIENPELRERVRKVMIQWYTSNTQTDFTGQETNISSEQAKAFEQFINEKASYMTTAETLRQNYLEAPERRKQELNLLDEEVNSQLNSAEGSRYQDMSFVDLAVVDENGESWGKMDFKQIKNNVAPSTRQIIKKMLTKYQEQILAACSDSGLLQRGHDTSDKGGKVREYLKEYDLTIFTGIDTYKKLRDLSNLFRSCGFQKAILSYVSTAAEESVGDDTEDESQKEHLKEPKYSLNTIIFGAPGTGKSYLLKQEVEGDEQNKPSFGKGCYERVTFHPEYTYFDFVGTYKPVMVTNPKTKEKKIEYGFVQGPFAIVLKKALLAQEKVKNTHAEPERFLLLIEEINRARMAAVFGDIFQLLDRNDNGESEYDILPSLELARYLQDNEELEEKDIRRISLPSNLYIWATMNSADQGVFPMDTAFKRRWDFEYLDIDAGKDKLEGEYAGVWNAIRKEINVLLQKAKINEDKQMGPFFLKKAALQNQDAFIKAFKSKVVMYLYEDAAKHKKQEVFKEPEKTYSAICRDLDSFQESASDELLNKLLSIFKVVK